MTTDEQFMQRALDLALLGTGTVSPNPMVGCVIVHNDRIIGEGWHKIYGGPHAEVHAVASVNNESILSQSTVYVNLEPCAHHGKTPPCADLLVKHKVKRVVIANVDSNELVAGKGIKKLLDAGIDVQTGVLQKEGRNLNKRFFTLIEKKRPYIILKWAETSDGFIARENYDSKWISNEHSRQLVHRWRAEEDAVLVGTSTARRDNPSLNVREWSGRNPVRIFIDRNLSLQTSLHLFDRQQPTICYNLSSNEQTDNLSYVKLDDYTFVNGLLKDLYQRKIQSVIVEGGSQTLNLFIENDLWDEARIFRSSQAFEKGIAAPKITGNISSQQNIAGDDLTILEPLKT